MDTQKLTRPINVDKRAVIKTDHETYFQEASFMYKGTTQKYNGKRQYKRHHNIYLYMPVDIVTEELILLLHVQ